MFQRAMWKWWTLSSVSLAALYAIKRYFAGGICTCERRLDGKVIIVTGANSGIGKVTATILAGRGATIILACRNESQGRLVANDIGQLTGSSVCFEYLDLASFESIQTFVNRLESLGTRLYALVNNAGVFYHPFEITADGFETTFQTNYLGPFLLTNLLLSKSLLKKGARIINVTSEAHRIPTSLNLERLALPRPELGQFLKYGESKLCLVLFTKKIDSFNGVKAVCVNPGNVETSIYRNFPLLNNKILFVLQKPLRWLVVKTPFEGAQSVVHAVLCEWNDLPSGGYISDCIEKTPSKLAFNQSLIGGLWACSIDLIEKKLNINCYWR